MAVKDLVSGVLAESITTSTTNVLVTIAENIGRPGILAFFPTPPFYITIMPKSPTVGVANRLNSEILQVTAVDTDQVGNAALTCVRGKRDTTAKAFEAGSIVTVGVYTEDFDDVVYSGDPESVGDDYIDPASYSETEHKTGGTWIDGKPIYKKTIKYQNLPIGGTDIQHGVSNMGVVIKYESFCKIDNTTTLQVPTFASSSSNSMALWTTYSSYIKIFATIPMDLIYITLYYTKTTD